MITALVAVGGAIGAALRFAIDHSSRTRFGDERPLGILAVNVVGSLALGLAFGLALDDHLAPDPLQVLGVGVLGGFTTFSTVAVDTVLLGRDRLREGLGYVSVTLVASLGAAASGIALAGVV